MAAAAVVVAVDSAVGAELEALVFAQGAVALSAPLQAAATEGSRPGR